VIGEVNEDMIKNKNWFLWRALASLILVGLLIAGGLAVHYAGWSRGYQAGQLAAEGEEAPAPPYLPYAVRPFGPAPYPFRGGLLLNVVLLLLFLAIVGKLIRFIIWGGAWRHAMAGPWPAHWGQAYWRRAARWHRVHGPVPPWCWWGYEPSDEEAEEADAGPDAQS
jgi:hypothetical protein